MGFVSFEFILRLIGAVAGAIAGGFLGANLATYSRSCTRSLCCHFRPVGFLSWVDLNPLFYHPTSALS